jgi:hypothetical protein
MNRNRTERNKDFTKLRLFTSPWVDYIGSAFYYDLGLFL